MISEAQTESLKKIVLRANGIRPFGSALKAPGIIQIVSPVKADAAIDRRFIRKILEEKVIQTITGETVPSIIRNQRSKFNGMILNPVTKKAQTITVILIATGYPGRILKSLSIYSWVYSYEAQAQDQPISKPVPDRPQCICPTLFNRNFSARVNISRACCRVVSVT